jgi:hypothetical protein
MGQARSGSRRSFPPRLLGRARGGPSRLGSDLAMAIPGPYSVHCGVVKQHLRRRLRCVSRSCGSDLWEENPVRLRSDPACDENCSQAPKPASLHPFISTQLGSPFHLCFTGAESLRQTFRAESVLQHERHLGSGSVLAQRSTASCTSMRPQATFAFGADVLYSACVFPCSFPANRANGFVYGWKEADCPRAWPPASTHFQVPQGTA